ncbi:MAG: hypothetical protein AAGC74_03725 [Verrucomicrobiota bacterium]
MKRFTLLTLLGLSLNSFAQFSSGSDGSDGELTVGSDTSVTLQVPEDGIFNFTSVTVGFRGNVFFTPNAANTPIYILSTGDISLTGRIYVNAPDNNRIQAGLGGPGGFAGGPGGPNPGDGLGPGGGKGGTESSGSAFRGGGSFASQAPSTATTTTRGSIYGNPLLVPLVGGSGGGGATSGVGGAGGGGAICLASDTRIFLNWNNSWAVPLFDASGGTSASNTGVGSGGAIRLVAPDVSGIARFDIQPGNTTYGGYGRIRVDSLNPSQFGINSVGSSSTYMTQGSNMVVFPSNQPTIRVTEAAGSTVDPARTDPLFVLLPVGTGSDQDITVEVTDFGTVVPLRVTVTPEQGAKATFDFTIDNTAGGTSSGTTTVQIPAGTQTRVDVWTR